MQVAKPVWSLYQPEAGPSQLPPPQPEVRPSMLPKDINVRSRIAMEVDDYIPEWLMEEQGYKPYTGPPTVLKRQCHKGLGPPIKIGAFNSIEDLEKDYLVCFPSNSLTDPAFCWEREGIVNKITIEHLMMKSRISGPSPSIPLPPVMTQLFYLPNSLTCFSTLQTLFTTSTKCVIHLFFNAPLSPPLEHYNRMNIFHKEYWMGTHLSESQIHWGVM